MSKESYFIGCAEVAELVGCGKSRAYKYIQQMNQELEARGNLTFPGRVPRRSHRTRGNAERGIPPGSKGRVQY